MAKPQLAQPVPVPPMPWLPLFAQGVMNCFTFPVLPPAADFADQAENEAKE